MDGATKAQLRSQLLANDGLESPGSVNTMSGFAANGKSQLPEASYPPPNMNNFPPGQSNFADNRRYPQNPQNPANLSNHDLITPVLESGAYPSSASRKASMTSMSMQRFFRRKGNGGQFDEENGADIGDFAGGSEVSLSDIKHLRGSGRYNITTSTVDTAPIIPVLGLPGSNTKRLNNVEYRKFMNHQKKLNLAQNARTMSLAGGGPSTPGQDPRSMSFTNGPSNRAMSLGNSLNNSGPNSRAMSLNSNAMLQGYSQPGFGPMGNNRPRPPMQGVPPQFNTNQAYPGSPVAQSPHMQYNRQFPAQGNHFSPNHTMSLKSGNSFPYRGQGPRANSLSNNGMLMGPDMRQGSPMDPRSQSLRGGPGYSPMMNPNMMGMPQGPSHNAYQSGAAYTPNYGEANGYHSGYGPQRMDAQVHPDSVVTSTDSLMNVKEEDEEEDNSVDISDSKSKTSATTFGASAHTSLPLPSSPSAEDDTIYNFGEGDNSPQISRKSTLKNSSSMRVRKLDIFGASPPDSPEKTSSNRSNALDTSNARSEEKHNRLLKTLPDIPDDVSQGDSNSISPEPKANNGKHLLEDETSKLKLSGSQNSLDSRQNVRSIKLKSLTQNTAFSRMHLSSLSSETTTISNTANKELDGPPLTSTCEISYESQPNESTDFSHYQEANNSRAFSESQTVSSSYSADDSKRTDTNATQESAFTPTEDSQKNTISEEFSDQSPVFINNDERPISSSSRNSQIYDLNGDAKDPRGTTIKQESALSRSNSELRTQGYTPSSALLRADTLDKLNNPVSELDGDRKDKRKSNNSISSKSRNLMKRFSISGSRKVNQDDQDNENDEFSRGKVIDKPKKPLSFSKEELAIMSCNHELQNELQLVTNELALSIKRELALESQLRPRFGAYESNGSTPNPNTSDDLEKSKIISDLQEKLNKERRLRFISEEHAILAEHGQSPSALKLDYEKNEIYNQLLTKNEMVIQLQDKLEELTSARANGHENGMLHKFNDLLRENAELKAKLEDYSSIAGSNTKTGVEHSEARERSHEHDQAMIISLRTQRDELREMITKLASAQNVELKVAQDRIKTLEAKLEKSNLINQKLSKRVEKTAHKNETSQFEVSQGGKLQGFTIVSSSSKLFDE